MLLQAILGTLLYQGSITPLRHCYSYSDTGRPVCESETDVPADDVSTWIFDFDTLQREAYEQD